MVARTVEVPAASRAGRRCQCGHFAGAHMRVVPAGGSASFALEPVGGCAVCGDAGCRKYAPVGTGSVAP
ncbi:MAG: hypothetical protein L3K18_06275 [Thermoplasmata archaeon]|nr:hypothetical protein [Thermoplasmata archaeon]MCI4356729.1 hypothetical protein [Thermoplasmata archaeon]